MQVLETYLATLWEHQQFVTLWSVAAAFAWVNTLLYLFDAIYVAFVADPATPVQRQATLQRASRAYHVGGPGADPYNRGAFGGSIQWSGAGPESYPPTYSAHYAVPPPGGPDIPPGGMGAYSAPPSRPLSQQIVQEYPRPASDLPRYDYPPPAHPSRQYALPPLEQAPRAGQRPPTYVTTRTTVA